MVKTPHVRITFWRSDVDHRNNNNNNNNYYYYYYYNNNNHNHNHNNNNNNNYYYYFYYYYYYYYYYYNYYYYYYYYYYYNYNYNNYNYNYNYATTTPRCTKLHYTNYNCNPNHNYNYATLQHTTLDYTALHYPTLHYTRPITPLTIWLQLHYTNYTTPQLQLHYITTTAALHHTLNPAVVVAEVTTATIATTPTITNNQLSVHQWHCPAIRESQQPTSPIGFLFWNFRHRLVRYYWY